MPDTIQDYLKRDGILKAIEKFRDEKLDDASGIVLCWRDTSGKPWTLDYGLNEYEVLGLLHLALDMSTNPDNCDSEFEDLG